MKERERALTMLMGGGWGLTDRGRKDGGDVASVVELKASVVKFGGVDSALVPTSALVVVVVGVLAETRILRVYTGARRKLQKVGTDALHRQPFPTS